ncbi:RHO guanyl-nucleotide exchange factor 8 [Perilla frutescens var. hirtella]|uniref:RHO guanyl-nucleotide exchange factor 8 n=1 Tax=Perilla frutescens var. hirtella TaxID=608512 RepID=A0AAD4NVN2_PERFH|nr:RHO guanyl-nucleotide exchange factor 8 [Perilla frutescens var. hirtella]
MLDTYPVAQAHHNGVQENGSGGEAADDKKQIQNESPASAAAPPNKEKPTSDMDLMKEKFSKLLLGEDMSGGGKGVSSALALSNAITNLAASVYGEQSKLEPMPAKMKERWKKEIDWFLSVTDYIVEFVPSQQKTKEGSNMEIMVTQQRRDLLQRLPALRDLDMMLVEILDNFAGEQEFKYVSRDAVESEKGVQRNHKWWLPTVKVPPSGLSEESLRFLKKQKERVNQVLKASMDTNSQSLADMEIPESYIESLPKNGRESLGESLYKSITDEHFDPLQFLSALDLPSEHKILDLKNRIEACIVIWQRKISHKDAKSSWGSTISSEKRELFGERAKHVLQLLKQNFPGIPQSALEISKIQYNKDVGLSILESYSRVLETLANTVMSRIKDVLYANALAMTSPDQSGDSTPSPTVSSFAETTPSATLSDFISWDKSPSETEIGANELVDGLETYIKDEEEKIIRELASIKKFSYTDKVEMGGLRSQARG